MPAEHGLQVHRRPADKQHFATGTANFGNLLVCRLHVIRDAELLVGIQNVNQMVGHGVLLFQRRLRRANIHPSIDGHRVQGNDVGIEQLRQLQPHTGLAGRCGAGQIPAIQRRWHRAEIIQPWDGGPTPFA